MSHWELPLVFFTVLSQWAVGLVATLTAIEYFSPTAENDDGLKSLRLPGMAVFPLAGLALLLSLAHLGDVIGAVYAVTNLGTSWLSREVLLFAAFGFVSLVYSYTWWKTPTIKKQRRWLGLIATVIGALGVLTTAQVYLLPARLAWNSWQTIAAFIGSAFVLGSITVSTALVYSNRDIDRLSLTFRTLGWTLGSSLCLIAVVLASFAQSYSASVEHTRAVLATVSSGMFWFRLIAGIMIPGWLALQLVSKEQKLVRGYALTALVLTVMGELSGRALFYYSVMHQQPWF